MAVQRRHLGLLGHSRIGLRRATVLLGSIMFLAIFLPSTCGGETAMSKYSETLKDVDSNLQQVKQIVGITAVVVATDAQLEAMPARLLADGRPR